MKLYKTYVINAYDSTDEHGMFVNNVLIELIAENADGAIEQAKKLIEKQEYYISAVVDGVYEADHGTVYSVYFVDCYDQRIDTQMVQYVQIQFIAESFLKAIERAKNEVLRKYYQPAKILQKLYKRP